MGGYEAYWCSRTTYYEGHWAVCHKMSTGLNYVPATMLPTNYQGHIQTYSMGGAGIWWSTESGTFRYDADKDTAVRDGGYLTHISVGGWRALLSLALQMIRPQFRPWM